MKRATLITGGVVLALALAAGAGFAYSAASTHTAVGTAPVIVEPLSVTVSASGSVDTAHSQAVFPAVSGTLATVAVKDGDQVANGATIATLDAEPLELAVAQAKSSLTTAKAALTAAKAQREIVEDKFSVQTEKRAAREAVVAAEQTVGVAEQVVRQAEANLSDRTLVAPIAGIVNLPPSTEAGLGVSPGVAIATVVDPSELEFVAAVDEADIAAVQTGKPATVTLDAFGAEGFPGTIATVRTTPQTTATGGIAYLTRISFDPGAERVFLGMGGSAELEVEAIAEAVTVPVEAVVTEGANRYVYVVGADNVAHRTPVTIGAETDTRAQVLEGVSPGDLVVTTGATTLSDGQTVQATA